MRRSATGGSAEMQDRSRLRDVNKQVLRGGGKSGETPACDVFMLFASREQTLRPQAASAAF